MLGTVIQDEVESRRGTVAGLGLLPVRTVFDPVKTLARPAGFGLGEPVGGYEIHNGQVRVEGGESLFTDASGAALEGCRDGAVWGTIWHGALESDGFRRAYLAEVARVCGLRFEPDPGVSFAAEREKQLDRLGDAVQAYVDTERLWRLIEDGPTAGLPLLRAGCCAELAPGHTGGGTEPGAQSQSRGGGLALGGPCRGALPHPCPQQLRPQSSALVPRRLPLPPRRH